MPGKALAMFTNHFASLIRAISIIQTYNKETQLHPAIKGKTLP